MSSTLYLIPCVLDELALNTIPLYIIDAVKNCQVIFAENERTSRRFLKSICKEIIIDEYEWFTIHKAEAEQIAVLKQKIKEVEPSAEIILYGSRARNTAKKHSDWDFLVLSDQNIIFPIDPAPRSCSFLN